MQSVGRVQRSDVSEAERGVGRSWAAAARPLSAKSQLPAAQPLPAFQSTWLPSFPAVVSPWLESARQLARPSAHQRHRGRRG